jgi:pimeloyl-ACP methyl ester carboxylesterase
MLDCSAFAGAKGAGAAGLRVRPGRGRHALPAWIVEPADAAPGARPVVAVHGIARDAEGMARRLADRARGLGRTLIVPLFSKEDFPRYQRAACDRRADRALLGLLDALVSDGTIPAGPVDLAGYSGGAQFAHRFAWLYPHRAGRLILAAAGWWTFPDAAPFPYGLGAAVDGPADAPRWLRANAADFLDRAIAVAVGAEDCVPDANTRSGPAIDAQQGADRLTRARRWSAAIRDAAERFGLPPRVSLTVLPGCGHNFQTCADAGLDRLILPCDGRGCRRPCNAIPGASR